MFSLIEEIEIILMRAKILYSRKMFKVIYLLFELENCVLKIFKHRHVFIL